MPLPASIADLSQTAGLNSPAGSESPTVTDDYFRTYASFIALLRDGKGHATELDIASAATCDIGAANSQSLRVTGTTTITSFGANYNGPRFIRFAGALILTNSGSLVLPGGVNITTAAGDTCIAVPIGSPSSGWQVLSYQLAAVAPAGVAVGSIHYFPAISAPAGYVKLDGSLLSRATYPALWAFAQASGNISATDAAWTAGQFSPGDGSFSFRVPNLCGYHLRAYDNGQGIDPGRTFGSIQADAVLSHNHVATANVADPGHAHSFTMGTGTGPVMPNDAPDGNSTTQTVNTSTATTGISVGVNVQLFGATENRVKNIAWLACIKY